MLRLSHGVIQPPITPPTAPDNPSTANSNVDVCNTSWANSTNTANTIELTRFNPASTNTIGRSTGVGHQPPPPLGDVGAPMDG